MGNSIENKREQWREIVKLYEFLSATRASYQPMLELARWLANSPYSPRVSASTSHARLNLSAQETSRRGQWQVAQISGWRDELCVDFYRYEAGGGFAKLSRDYAADEIRAAIEAWLWRLEMDNAWE